MHFPLLSVRFWLLISILIGATIQSARSQTHIDTLKNNAVSFEFGLPFYTLDKFSEFGISPLSPSIKFKYHRDVLKQGSFILSSEIGIGANTGDACDLQICPTLDLSLMAQYGFKRHFVIFGLGNNFYIFNPITGYYSIGYQYLVSKKAFIRFSINQILWYRSMKFWVSSDECEDCYETRYNLWAWDLNYSVFKIQLGMGIKF